MECATTPWNKWESMELGTPGSLNYRVIFLDSEGKEASLWRDVPLFGDGDLVHYVCTTPSGSRTSYHVEIAEDDPSLKLSLHNGKISSYLFPSPWNIGMLPQTWSDPNQSNTGPFVGLLNDGQPIQVINISETKHQFGSAYLIKPLVAFALTNEVNLTWHIVAVDACDPYASYITNINDIDNFFPGILPRVRDWLQERFGDEDDRAMILGQVKNSTEEMINVICRAHASWKLFSTLHLEWKQRSAEIMNYGRTVWENYTAHDSKATLPSFEQLTNSDILYDMAWASSESELYTSSSESDISYNSKRFDVDGFGASRRGDLITFLKSRMSSRLSSGFPEEIEAEKEQEEKRPRQLCFPIKLLAKKMVHDCVRRKRTHSCLEFKL